MGSHHPIRKFVAPEPVAIPDKLYFRIGDVARLCHVPAYVLRFWETEFPNLKPNKGGTGQRLYRRKDVEMALRIKTLLYDQGYTIPGARQVFKTEAKSRETTGSASSLAVEPLVSPSLSPLRTTNTDPDSRVGDDAAAVPGIGEAIRRRAQQEPHLHTLRDDLRQLLTQLGGPTRLPAPAATSADAKPTRPSLILEPQPRVEPKVEPKPPAPQPEPDLHIAQGDLFSTE